MSVDAALVLELLLVVAGVEDLDEVDEPDDDGGEAVRILADVGLKSLVLASGQLLPLNSAMESQLGAELPERYFINSSDVEGNGSISNGIVNVNATPGYDNI